MLFVYLVLEMSIVLTCAPNKHVRNAWENRKGLLQNSRKGLLPNKQHKPFVLKLISNYKNNLCTQMAISFSAEMKIESKNYNIAIFIYSKIEKKKFNTNILLFIFLIQITIK